MRVWLWDAGDTLSAAEVAARVITTSLDNSVKPSVYLCRLQAGQFRGERKLILLP